MNVATATAWVVLPIIAGAGLYMIKMQVEAQEQRLAGLERQITDTRESIHVLKAEWSYLNDPARLRDEAQRLLGMVPIKPSQIATIDSIPMADPPASSADPGPLARNPAANSADDPIAGMIAALANPPRNNHQ